MNITKPRRPILSQDTVAKTGQPEGGGARLSRLSERFAPYWLLIPSLICMAGVLIYPLVYSLYISFFNYRLARTDTTDRKSVV